MKLKKIAIIGLTLASTFCATGCMNKEYTNDEVMEVIASTAQITKYQENISLAYAVDDIAITASGKLKHDIKNKISSGTFKVKLNEDILNIELIEKEGKTYFLDNNGKYYYMNISLQKINSLLNNNIDKDTISFINIKQDKDDHLNSYRLDLKTDKEFNNQLIEIGKVFFNRDDIKNIDKLSVQKSLNFEDGYSYKTEINLVQILESNLIKDTSVIGVANLISEIEDLKEDIKIDDSRLDDAEELSSINTFLNTFIKEEVE